MAYDEKFATRIRNALGPNLDVTEKKMFGGLAFLFKGKMFCGIAKDELMLRVGPDDYEEALAQKHVRVMDFTGRPMKGYVFVEPAGIQTSAALKKWVGRGLTYVAAIADDKKRTTPKNKRVTGQRARR